MRLIQLLKSTKLDEMAFYHGSPHAFDEFQMSAIGTGEGHQAFGWGIYFGEHPETAAYYQEQLSENEWYYDGRPAEPMVAWDAIGQGGPQNFVAAVASGKQKITKNTLRVAYRQIDQEIARLQKEVDVLTARGMQKVADRPMRSIQRLEQFKKEIEALDLKRFEYRGGYFYKVEIPDEIVNKFLDLYKPMEEQPYILQRLEARRRLIQKKLEPIQKALDDYDAEQKEKGEVDLLALFTQPEPPEAKVFNQNWYAKKEITDETEMLDYLLNPNSKVPSMSAGNMGMANPFGKSTHIHGDGANLYHALAVYLRSPKAASEYLNSIGIRGLQYLDRGSRWGGGGGSRNVVIFSDKIVKNLRRTPVPKP